MFTTLRHLVMKSADGAVVEELRHCYKAEATVTHTMHMSVMNKVKHFQEMQRCNKCFVVEVVYVCMYI